MIAGRDDLVPKYLDALALELSWLEEPREVDTLYVGGGTPTRLSPEMLDRLCAEVLRWHPLAAGYEWTVEANPGDLDRDRLDVLLRWGVNRLSLGGQSFRVDKLKLLERSHAAADIQEAVEQARTREMQVALDLIFAAPGETLAQWKDDLSRAVQLEPDHISTYGLTYERGTRFWSRLQHGEIAAVGEELEREMYLTAIDTLADAGYEHYEISNFARFGMRSRHNEAYWLGREYYAAGPGAARYIAGVRQTNHRSTSTYLRRVLDGKSPVAETEHLNDEQRAREALVFGLRRIEGLEREEFSRRVGYDIDQLAGTTIHRFVKWGLLEDDGSRVRLTREGVLVSDSLWPDLL